MIDPTPTDRAGRVYLAHVGTFETRNSGIRDSTGLEFAVNLATLPRRLNAIDDVSPLAAHALPEV